MKRIFLFLLLIMQINLFAQMVKPVVLISGKVLNERNMQPVDADVRIIYETLPGGEEAGIARQNPLNGDYKIILPYGKKYAYYALAEGYYSFTRNLDVKDLKEYKEIDEQNLFLAPLLKDQVSILNSIFFKGRTSELLPESFPELNRFYKFLKTNKHIEIEISGHTDNSGKIAENLTLSQQRAKQVADYLINKGIKDYRITVKGYGQTMPITFNSNKVEKKRNNRIEFKITSLKKTKK